MRKVVLLSGGIDSLVCAEMARAADQLAGCVFVDYGHPAQVAEGWKAFAYCGMRRVPLKVVHVFGLDLGDMGTEEGARVVPHRNLILLSVAANAASSMGNGLVLGANLDDAEAYDDCRLGWVREAQRALGVAIHTPLIDLPKSTVIELAREYGLRPDDAWSCYGAGPDPCGTCPSCEQSAAAWGSIA